MRWIMKPLAIAVAGVLVVGSANKPAYAQLDIATTATLNAAIASGDSTTIAAVMANFVATNNAASINAIAAALVNSGSPSLIAAVVGNSFVAGGAGGAAIASTLVAGGNATLIGQVIAQAPPAVSSNVVSVVGTAVAGSPNAVSLAPSVATAIISNGGSPTLAGQFGGQVAASNAIAGQAVAAIGITLTAAPPAPQPPPPPLPPPPRRRLRRSRRRRRRHHHRRSAASEVAWGARQQAPRTENLRSGAAAGQSTGSD
jgi:hypothetical protein